MNERWNRIDRPLILASQSPRRKRILTQMGFTFTVVPPSIENENTYIHRDAVMKSLQELACAKARSVSAQYSSSLILGCDTVVVIDKKVIGKPVNIDDARTMLHFLSGRSHKVYSGVALICPDCNFEKTAVASTDVFFRDIPEWEIDEYLTNGEYSDKAGAYAIQGKAMTFIDKIHGCFYNVMGLPLSETIALYQAYSEFLKGIN
jgi:septum formation protein